MDTILALIVLLAFGGLACAEVYVKAGPFFQALFAVLGAVAGWAVRRMSSAAYTQREVA